MTPSKALFFFCIALIIGIFLESLIKIPAEVLWGFLVGAVIFITAGFFKKEALIVGFCLLFLVLGAVRLQISEFTIASDALGKLNDAPEKITLVGVVIAEPDVRNSSQKLNVKVGRSVVLVTTDRRAQYHYLDAIEITGKLKTPVVSEDFNYKNYLAKDGVYSVMDFPVIQTLPQPHEYTILSYAYEKILFIKSVLVTSLNNNFSPPDDAILEGIIFGNDKNMEASLKEQFNATGLSHVTAVSGTNIVILINILVVSLLALGLWRGQAFYGAVFLIWLYIIMIGFPISGVRAAIMGCVGLTAQKLGRQNASSRVLTMTAGAMLLENPMLLFYDISFQLSFLASLGIIYVKPLIDYYLSVISWEKSRWLLAILSVTLAAQIITLPIIVYNFGRISLVAPLTNILVLPIIEMLTIAGFLTSLAGAISNILGFLFSLPCLAMLWYFTGVLDIFSKSWAVVIVENVSWIWAVVYYIFLTALVIFLQKLQRPKFLG